jgi:hypothetical protein
MRCWPHQALLPNAANVNYLDLRMFYIAIFALLSIGYHFARWLNDPIQVIGRPRSSAGGPGRS